MLLRLLVSAVLLAGIFRLAASFSKTVHIIADAQTLYLVLGLGAALLGEFLTALKWQWLLESTGQRAGIWLVLRATMIGMFYNCLLPGSVGGDIAKALVVSRRSGGLVHTAASIFVQRNTGMAALLVISCIAGWLWPVRVRVFPARLALLNNVEFWFALIALAYLLVNAMLFSRRLYHLIWRLLRRFRISSEGRLATPVNRLLEIAQRLHESLLLFRKGIPRAVAISLVTQLNDCLMVFLVARAVHLDAPFYYFCIFVPVTALAALLPISFNGIGLREMVYIVLLDTIGAVREQAVAISFVHFGYLLFMAALGGAIQWTTAKTEQAEAEGERGREPPCAA